mmetsp:Transcript_5562/g.15103  ORF Transcript_5562/g.15103 Transcript_5562/m.15103 type:complete len:101 (-) Transcript_5562:42-344(-)
MEHELTLRVETDEENAAHYLGCPTDKRSMLSGMMQALELVVTHIQSNTNSLWHSNTTFSLMTTPTTRRSSPGAGGLENVGVVHRDDDTSNESSDTQDGSK